MEYLVYLLFILSSIPTPNSSLQNYAIRQQNLWTEISRQKNNDTLRYKYYNTTSKTEELIFEDSLKHLYKIIGLEKYELSYTVFKCGMIGYYMLRQQGKLNNKNFLSIIDFTKSSCKKRFYTIDLDHLIVKYYTYVSHGKNTGEDVATSFSNALHSNQSSLGFYVTGETYRGSKGYSLKLDGVEKGYNNNMRERAVVMHEAEYVSEFWINRYGRLGRSQGCPALPKEISKEIIDDIKNQTAIFAYYNDANYLKVSSYLDLNKVLLQNTLTAKIDR